MLKAWEYWTLTIAGALALILVIINIMQFQGNHALQAQIAQQNQTLQQAAQLQGLNNNIIQALAQLAQRDGDKAVRDLLAANGVTFAPAPAPTAAASKP